MTINPLRYAGIYLISMIIMGLVSVGLAMVIDVDLSGAASIMPTIAAAMIEGQKQGAASGRKFENSEAWRAASIATLLLFGITMMIGALLIMLTSYREIIAQLSFGIVAGILVVALAIQLAANRWFLQVGAKAAAEKAAA